MSKPFGTATLENSESRHFSRHMWVFNWVKIEIVLEVGDVV